MAKFAPHMGDPHGGPQTSPQHADPHGLGALLKKTIQEIHARQDTDNGRGLTVHSCSLQQSPAAKKKKADRIKLSGFGFSPPSV